MICSSPLDEWDGDIVALGVYPLPNEWAAKVAPIMKKAFLPKHQKNGDIFLVI